jgi:hypothetical protein
VSSLPPAVREVVEARIVERWTEETAAEKLRTIGNILPHCTSRRTELVTAALAIPATAWQANQRVAREMMPYLEKVELGRLEDLLGVNRRGLDDATLAALAAAWARVGALERAEHRRRAITGEDERAAAGVAMAIAAPDRLSVVAALEQALAGSVETGALVAASRAVRPEDAAPLAALIRRVAFPDDRLRAWSELLPRLPETHQAGFWPDVDRAVDEVLRTQGSDDEALLAIARIAPIETAERIWAYRAAVGRWRRTVDPSDRHLFAFIASEHYLHADWILSLLNRLGEPGSVVGFARMLADTDAWFSSARNGA